MRRATTLSAVALFLLAATAVQAAPPGRMTFTETFDENNNTGGWTLGNPFLEAIDTTGGNPGAFLHFPDLDTFAPQPRTTVAGSVFTGNYRDQGVSSVGIDLVLYHVDFSSADRPLSLVLRSDGGTPDDFSDDCAVYVIGNKASPAPNGRWKTYRLKVPSDSPALPRGWNVLDCGSSTPDEAWDRVIQDVDQLTFFVGDPTLFFIFQVWDIGMDNPTITWGTADRTLAPPSFEVDGSDLATGAPALPRR